MATKYITKPEQSVFLYIAIDFIRKHPKTSKMDVKSLKIIDHNQIFNISTGVGTGKAKYYHKFKFDFTIDNNQHEIEIIIADKQVVASDFAVSYAILDGHYDMLLKAEVEDVQLSVFT